MKSCPGWISILLLLVLSASSIFVAFYLNQVISQRSFWGAPSGIRKFDFESLGIVLPSSLPFAMGHAPQSAICNYKAVLLDGRGGIMGSGDFGPLKTAQSCGTKVIIRFTKTSDMLNDNGVGLDLAKLEASWGPLIGGLDPFVGGTVVGHLVIDEPHDCGDWGGDCPNPSEVDEAAKISEKYWPSLPTWVNTLSNYIGDYKWQTIDVVSFMYAYHKGPLSSFVAASTSVLDRGLVGNISWAMNASQGGCAPYGTCQMTPEQVLEVGRAMCDTSKGLYVGFGFYPASLSPGISEAISQLRAYCGG